LTPRTSGIRHSGSVDWVDSSIRTLNIKKGIKIYKPNICSIILKLVIKQKQNKKIPGENVS
jgi:hypothetical protein